jgi:hypothetical protein
LGRIDAGLSPIPRLAGRLKTGNLSTGQNRQFRRGDRDQ